MMIRKEVNIPEPKVDLYEEGIEKRKRIESLGL